jgi:hypothetical protein
MKLLSFIPVLLLLSIRLSAQTATTPSSQISSLVYKQPPLDKSPMDMAYYPTDYPMLKTQNKVTQPPVARVIYSRPQKEGRVIFGDLIEYDKVWRLGANEATEIEFYRDITIAGKKITRGRYTLYAIPSTTTWTLILNKDTDTWGAFVYDQKKDILRTEVPVQVLPAVVEVFSMNFIRTDKGANLVIAWENVSTSLSLEFK